MDNYTFEYICINKSISEVILLYVKLTNMEGLETLVVWLTCAEQEDKNILQLIDKCKNRMNVIVFLSGTKYTLKETIDTLLSNHLKKNNHL